MITKITQKGVTFVHVVPL